MDDIRASIMNIICSGRTDRYELEDEVSFAIGRITHRYGSGGFQHIGYYETVMSYGIAEGTLLSLSVTESKNITVIRLATGNILGVFKCIDESIKWDYYNISNESLHIYSCMHHTGGNDKIQRIELHESNLEHIEKPQLPTKSARR